MEFCILPAEKEEEEEEGGYTKVGLRTERSQVSRVEHGPRGWGEPEGHSGDKWANAGRIVCSLATSTILNLLWIIMPATGIVRLNDDLWRVEFVTNWQPGGGNVCVWPSGCYMKTKLLIHRWGEDYLELLLKSHKTLHGIFFPCSESHKEENKHIWMLNLVTTPQFLSACGVCIRWNGSTVLKKSSKYVL